MLLLLIISIITIIIGSVAMNFAARSEDPNNINQDDDIHHLTELAGVILGYGLGLLMPILLKFAVIYFNTKSDANKEHNSQIAMFAGIAICSLFALIVGCWSWSSYDNCKHNYNNQDIGNSAGAGINGFVTILSVLIFIICCVYMISRAAGKHNIADAIYNFRKTTTSAVSSVAKKASTFAKKSPKMT